MSKNLSPKYFRDNKERLQKKSREKKQQYSREHCKNLSEDEKQNWLSIEKNIIKWETTLYYNLKKSWKKAPVEKKFHNCKTNADQRC